MKIYITRHSLTAWNEEKRLQGWKDSPLTKQGKEDALKLGEYMKTIHIDQVYSSPLLRAKSTARLIFKNENIIAFGDGLNDIDMIEKCGIGVAMKNALIDVKEKANFITDKTNLEDGIIDFLQKYL